MYTYYHHMWLELSIFLLFFQKSGTCNGNAVIKNQSINIGPRKQGAIRQILAAK